MNLDTQLTIKNYLKLMGRRKQYPVVRQFFTLDEGVLTVFANGPGHLIITTENLDHTICSRHHFQLRCRWQQYWLPEMVQRSLIFSWWYVRTDAMMEMADDRNGCCGRRTNRNWTTYRLGESAWMNSLVFNSGTLNQRANLTTSEILFPLSYTLSADGRVITLSRWWNWSLRCD